MEDSCEWLIFSKITLNFLFSFLFLDYNKKYLIKLMSVEWLTHYNREFNLIRWYIVLLKIMANKKYNYVFFDTTRLSWKITSLLESFIIFNPIISSLFSANKTDTDLTDRW